MNRDSSGIVPPLVESGRLPFAFFGRVNEHKRKELEGIKGTRLDMGYAATGQVKGECCWEYWDFGILFSIIQSCVKIVLLS